MHDTAITQHSYTLMHTVGGLTMSSILGIVPKATFMRYEDTGGNDISRLPDPIL